MRTSAIAAVTAIVWALSGGVAMAADEPTLTVPTKPVAATDCAACHANMADDQVPNIKFSHAAHIVYGCTECHDVHILPYAGTVLPKMKACWNCHALRHGPQGIMAAAECAKCHIKTEDLRPKSHVKDWALTPHVQPGEDKLSTECMMCHTQKFCEDCHDAKQIIWTPAAGAYAYDVGMGCLACHRNPMPRLEQPVAIEGSAHRETECGKCHPDFKYVDTANVTKLWRINAGKACADCHATSDVAKNFKTNVTDEYAVSDHGKAVAKGDFTAPTCATCHGGHDINRTDTDAAKRALKMSGLEMCGGSECHADYVSSYDDYYHGRAYKAQAPDSPACWECHEAHSILEKKDPKSTVAEVNQPKTCGTCHEGSEESFTVASDDLPHNMPEVREENPLAQLMRAILPGY